MGCDDLPSHKVHRFVDRQLFGRSFGRVHRKIDEPYLLLRSKHRVLFHDPAAACAIAQYCYPGCDDAVLAALNHINLDLMCSNDPAFKANLEILAEMDARERKKAKKAVVRFSRRRRRKTSADPLKEFAEFVRKAELVQDLHRELTK